MKTTTILQLAEKVGLRHVTCQHCRKKTDMSAVLKDWVEAIVDALVIDMVSVNLPGLGTFSLTRKKPTTQVVRTNGRLMARREGVTLKFIVTNTARAIFEKKFIEVAEQWREKWNSNG